MSAKVGVCDEGQKFSLDQGNDLKFVKTVTSRMCNEINLLSKLFIHFCHRKMNKLTAQSAHRATDIKSTISSNTEYFKAVVLNLRSPNSQGSESGAWGYAKRRKKIRFFKQARRCLQPVTIHQNAGNHV